MAGAICGKRSPNRPRRLPQPAGQGGRWGEDCNLRNAAFGRFTAPMLQASPIRRRRRWPLIAIVLLILLGGAWTAVWNYGAGVAARTIDGWKAREAKSGRLY